MIKVFNTKESFKEYRNSLAKELSVGLVPTMGNLHAGHLTLVQKSCQENDVTIVTIFVNPKQFGPTEDFNKYPRTFDQDLQKLTALEANTKMVVFAPKNDQEIYPENFSTNISVGSITQILCGKFRPTHFDGVTTVVYQLFNIAKAHNAYFGQKDFQQCVVIKKMVHDLEIPIKLHIMPIIRSLDGLALSSRNQYLNDEQRLLALHLPETLIAIENLLRENKNPNELIKRELENKAWDYLEILDTKELNAPTKNTKEVVVIGAYRLGATRLLDNRVVTINA